MKYLYGILLFFLLTFLSPVSSSAQCSVCTKTSQQLGEKPAQGMNSAILYLMLMPFAVVGFIGYRWWKNNKKFEEQESGGIPGQ
jgi:hypothetical protein